MHTNVPKTFHMIFHMNYHMKIKHIIETMTKS